jgi:cytochrome P450
MTTSTDLRELVKIEEPRFYLEDGYPVFARLRREAPVFYYEPLDTFVLTKHRHIREVASNPQVWSNARGLFLNDVKYAAQMAESGQSVTDSFFPKGGEQVGTADPPRHAELRRVLAPAFSARALSRMEDALRSYCRELLDDIVPGEPVDWMEKVAAVLPIRAGSLLIGLPDADTARVRHWSDELEKLGGDLTLEQLQAAAAEFQSLQAYITENAEIKRANPGNDLLSSLLEAELDNDRLSMANVVMFAMTMIAAGSDTTRALLAGTIWALANHPDQLAKLVADRSLIPNAIEESMRWVTPARAFLRTAVCDTAIDGTPIAEGQHVYLMYMSGNRDEDVFPDPERFDITRPESTLQLAFGSGAHVCAGSRLVRTEAAILLDELLNRFTRVELCEEPTPVVHVIRNSWTDMKVVFHR